MLTAALPAFQASLVILAATVVIGLLAARRFGGRSAGRHHLTARGSSALAVLVLAACASAPIADPGQEVERVKAQIAAVAKETASCYQRMQNVPRYAPIFEKLGVGSAPMTDAKLGDQAHISDDMIVLGLDWYAENQVCDQAVIEGFGQIDPEMGVGATGWIDEITAVVQYAATEKPTYAELNRRIVEIKDGQRRDVQAWAQGLRERLERRRAADLRAQRRSEESRQQFVSTVGTVADVAVQSLLTAVQVMADRQSALASVQRNYAIAYPVYVPVRKIRATTCRYVGSAFTCMTY